MYERIENMSVVFEPRVYPLDISYILAADTIYEGAGIRKTIFSANTPAAFSLLTATNRANITLRNMTINGNVTQPTNTRGSGISLNDCTNVKIENVETINLDQAGVYASGTDTIEILNTQVRHVRSGLVFNSCINGRIHDNIINGSDGDAIYMTDSSDDFLYGCREMWVERNQCFYTGDTAIDTSVKVTTKYSSGIHVLNNIIDGVNGQTLSETPNASGITISRAINSEYRHNTIRNMRQTRSDGFFAPFYQNAKGIYIGQMPGIAPLNTYVSNNTVINCDVPIRSQGILPAENIYDNVINPPQPQIMTLLILVALGSLGLLIAS